MPSDKTTDLLNPICAGSGLRSPDICPRCGATTDGPCGDPIARDAQEEGLENGTISIWVML